MTTTELNEALFNARNNDEAWTIDHAVGHHTIEIGDYRIDLWNNRPNAGYRWTVSHYTEGLDGATNRISDSKREARHQACEFLREYVKLGAMC